MAILVIPRSRSFTSGGSGEAEKRGELTPLPNIFVTPSSLLLNPALTPTRQLHLSGIELGTRATVRQPLRNSGGPGHQVHRPVQPDIHSWPTVPNPGPARPTDPLTLHQRYHTLCHNSSWMSGHNCLCCYTAVMKANAALLCCLLIITEMIQRVFMEL